MLLQKFNVTNSRGSVLELPLEDISNGFIVREIEGLGPVKATLVASSFANLDGQQYHTGRRETRNIIIKLGLVPNYAISSAHELRSQLYDFFMPKTEVLLEFTMFDRHDEETRVFQITGRIESFEPVIFAKEPTVDLSILCYDPSFVEPGEVLVEATSINSGVTPNLPLTTMPYDGSVETGVVLEMTLNQDTDRIRIYQTRPDQTQIMMDLQGDYDNGDILKVSSVVGDKFVTIRRGAPAAESRLYEIAFMSGWLTFYPGDNLVSVNVIGPVMPYTIQYVKRYGGL